MLNKDILNIAKQACLKISADEKSLGIRHTLRMGNESGWGVFLIVCGGVFFILVPFICESDTDSKLIFPVLGGVVLVFSFVSLLGEVIDGIKIENNAIRFRYGLIRTTIPLSENMKVAAKWDTRESKNEKRIVITHFIQYDNKEEPILEFILDVRKYQEAKQLGEELTKMLNAKIRQEFSNRP